MTAGPIHGTIGQDTIPVRGVIRSDPRETAFVKSYTSRLICPGFVLMWV
jgi:hypothetical protein